MDDVCSIDYGTRVVQKNEKGSTYFVYGGGGATFKVDRYNREDCFIVSRFAMSPKCTRFVSGKFFLNDSGLSVSTKDKRSLRQSFVDKALLANNDAIYAMGKGVAQKNLDMPSFRRLQIPIPPTAEQEKIVAELDCLTGIIEKKKQQLEELDKLAQSIFYDMFGDPIAVEKGWKVKKLGDLAELQRGLTYSKGDEVPFSSKCVLRSNNIDLESHTLDLTELKYLREDFAIPEDRKVKKNSIFICMSNGSKQHVGKVAFIGEEMDYAFGGFMGLIVPKEGINPRYVFYACQSSSFRLFLSSIGNGIGITNLRFPDLATYSFHIPPLGLQCEFAQKIEAIEKQKELVKQSIVETETLFNSRMDYWFN